MSARHRGAVRHLTYRQHAALGLAGLVITVGALVPMVACDDGPQRPPVVETPAPSPSRAAALQVGGDAIARALGEAGR